LGLVAVGAAHAADGIGAASTVSNRVEGFFGGDARSLAAGSEVFQNELVRTGLRSDAKLIFLDDTNLSVGPSSEVTLDRFVYDPDKSAGAVVVKTTKGLFRFVTGSQRPQNYLISTPIASIGVRGTIFDLLVTPDRVTVLLLEGQVLVTTLFNRTITLSQPGQSVTIYTNGRVVGPSVWRGSVYVDFASATFPYFPPVTAIKKKAAVPPRIKTATPTREVERPKRNRVSSREYEPERRVRIRLPKWERPRQRETKHYPPPQKQYPNQNQKRRRY
jgi:FecR protein